MIGNCIVAMLVSPILAEIFTFFREEFRGPLRSIKPIHIGALVVPPGAFRAAVFALIFMIFYPAMRYLAYSEISLRTDQGMVISYMCFLTVIEPLIMYINGDEESRFLAKRDPENLMFPMIGNVILMFIVIIVAIFGPKFITGTNFQFSL